MHVNSLEIGGKIEYADNALTEKVRLILKDLILWLKMIIPIIEVFLVEFKMINSYLQATFWEHPRK